MNFLEKEKIPKENLPGPPQSEKETLPVEFSLSAGLAARRGRLNLFLAFSSYQSNPLSPFGILPNGSAHPHQSAMAKPWDLPLTVCPNAADAAGMVSHTCWKSDAARAAAQASGERGES